MVCCHIIWNIGKGAFLMQTLVVRMVTSMEVCKARNNSNKRGLPEQLSRAKNAHFLRNQLPLPNMIESKARSKANDPEYDSRDRGKAYR